MKELEVGQRVMVRNGLQRENKWGEISTVVRVDGKVIGYDVRIDAQFFLYPDEVWTGANFDVLREDYPSGKYQGDALPDGISEGTVKKGGQNTPPTTPRPSDPQGQGPSMRCPMQEYVETEPGFLSEWQCRYAEGHDEVVHLFQLTRCKIPFKVLDLQGQDG